MSSMYSIDRFRVGYFEWISLFYFGFGLVWFLAFLGSLKLPNSAFHLT